MKYTLLLIATSLSCFFQSIEPTKGDNRIVITTAMPDTSSYRVIGRTLLGLGYTFKADREFGTFKTDEKAIPRDKNYQLIGNIAINNGKISLTGTIKSNISLHMGGASTNNQTFPAEYRSGGLMIHRFGFIQLDELAHKIAVAVNSDNIDYQKQ